MVPTIIDGVHRLLENGINVIVVGAGIAGLQAALETWRKGCNVVVLEKAKELSCIGDFFTITPSALTTLKDYPSMKADYHRCVYDCSIHIVTPSGSFVASNVPEWKRPNVVTASPDVNISFLKRRPEYARMQLDQAQRLGIPIHWGDEVAKVEEHDGGVVVWTASGLSYQGDVCIGADGISSKIPGFNTGPGPVVQDSGYAVARVAFPRSAIDNNRPAAALLNGVDKDPQFRTYVGSDMHLILFLTADWVAFALTHPDDGNALESWSHMTNSEHIVSYLQKCNQDWDPAVIDFIRAAPSQVVDWKLRWRDVNEQWTSDTGRLVRIGDAAHAFFPTAGNGAVQGLEDAVSLAECLRIAGKNGIQQATKVHNKLRFERVSILQQTGFLNREELHNVDVEAAPKDPQNVGVGFFRIGQWVWNHNPELYAQDNYKACLESVTDFKLFTNTNVPPGHVYQPWTLETEKRRMQAGIKSNLKSNGDWSA